MTPSATARRRAQIALVIAVTACFALSVLAGLQAAVLSLFLVFSAAGVLFHLPFLAWGTGLELDEERYLTGRTVSGPRTVDLERLVRVRRFRVPRGSFDQIMVELVDADGVRLVVGVRSDNRAVRAVVEELLVDATVVNRGWSHLAGLLCVVPPALVALAVHALT